MCQSQIQKLVRKAIKKVIRQEVSWRIWNCSKILKKKRQRSLRLCHMIVENPLLAKRVGRLEMNMVLC
ncbi:unnamed protein product [Lampetra planeri]